MTQTSVAVSGTFTITPGAPHRTPSTPPTPAAPPRLAWLDVLRAFAALVVVFFHARHHTLGSVFALFQGWLSTGRYGVILFFLVSGYVIPMSLQRYGSLRRFWVGRIFRIYPAWLLAVVAMAALIALSQRTLPRPIANDPATAALAHVTMLQELLGTPNFVYVFWTLSYEMIFYLVVSALFVLGLHKRCAWWAVALAVTALIGGRLLPDALFTAGDPNPRIVTAVVTLLVVASVAGYLSGRRRAALVAGVASLGMLVLPALNGAPRSATHAVGSWQSLAFLTVMFAGTVIYAAQHGELRRRTAALVLAAVGACLLAASWLHAPRPGQSAAAADIARREAVGTLVVVAATFALGYALRHRRVPGWAAWLGRISYSVYLLHPIVLYLVAPYIRGGNKLPFPVQLAIAAGYLAAVLLVSWLSYVAVERPGQRLGRRVIRALDRRMGPDRSAGAGADRTAVPHQVTSATGPGRGIVRRIRAVRAPRRVGAPPPR